jgi:hypothetical protein
MDKKIYFAGWNDRVQPFAEAVDKNLDDVSALLAVHTGDPVDEKSATAALEVLSSKDAFSDEELIKALESLKIPLGKLKLNIAKLRGVPVVVAEERATPNAYDAVLPSVPEDESFVASLKVGGELNSAQYVNVDSTITRSTQNSISVVSNIERNYSNT